MATKEKAPAENGAARTATGKRTKRAVPEPTQANRLRGETGCLKVLARRGLARAIGPIVEALVMKALEGSVPHLKLLMELAGMATGTAATGKRGKGVARMLLDEWQAAGGKDAAWSVVPAREERKGGADTM